MITLLTYRYDTNPTLTLVSSDFFFKRLPASSPACKKLGSHEPVLTSKAEQTKRSALERLTEHRE